MLYNQKNIKKVTFSGQLCQRYFILSLTNNVSQMGYINNGCGTVPHLFYFN